MVGSDTNLGTFVRHDARGFIGIVPDLATVRLPASSSGRAQGLGEGRSSVTKLPAQFIAPPIATVLLWGVFWRRGTRQAGTFTLLFGFVAGFIIFLFDMGFGFLGGVQYVSDPVNGLGIPFLLQAWWYFCVLSVIYVAVSLVTPAPKAEQIDGLTWNKPYAFLTRSEITGVRDPRLLAALLAVALVTMYVMVR